MSRDALQVLTRLRRFEVNAAQRDLAAGLRAVADAEDAQRAAGLAIARETAVTTTLAAEALVTDLFCRWLPHARAEVEATNAFRDAAEQQASRARAALAAAHAGAEAVEALRTDQARARRVVGLRTEQAALDEHAARSRPGGRHGASAQ